MPSSKHMDSIFAILAKWILFLFGVIIVFALVRMGQTTRDGKGVENFTTDVNIKNVDDAAITTDGDIATPGPEAAAALASIAKCSAGTSSLDLSTIGENIIKLYWELLERQPSSSELSKNSSQIKSGTLTMEGLRRKLVDTDEYLRFSKLQSNALNPELTKMLSDREVITYVANLYTTERGITIPGKMELPMRDIYMYLDYNDYAFRAMCSNPSYPEFEEEVMTTIDINKPELITLFLKYFTVDGLIQTGIQIFGADPSSKVACSINSSDMDSGPMLNSQHTKPGLFDKDAAARNGLGGNGKVVPFGDHVPFSMTQTSVSLELPIKDITTDQYGRKKIPIHKHDMVLIPELAWSVPQEFPQVCTTLGQKQLVQPVFNNSSLLLGTPLGDAADTQVGSIMPKFEYQLKEYVTIPN
jgi:hypothetical protein